MELGDGRFDLCPNLTSARSGPVFEERYFARRLATPRVVAAAIHYVLHNEAHHLRGAWACRRRATRWHSPRWLPETRT